MGEHDPSPAAIQEQKQLLFLSSGLGLASIVLWWLRPWSLFPIALTTFCLMASAGGLAYPLIGRDVYVVFELMGDTLGRAVSWLSIVIMYGIAIVLGGSLLRLGGMDQLRRRFSACRALGTMFEAAPKTTRETFGRQS
jgi:hypothetical protein